MNSRELLSQVSGPFSRFRAAAKRNMQSIKCERPFRLIGMSIALLGLLGSTMAVHAQSNSDLTGTWIIEVSFNGASCNPGDVVLFQCNYGLETFHSDGTMAEVDTFASGARQSWGTGLWTPNGKDLDGLFQFNVTFEQLQFSGGGNASHYDTVWGPVVISNDGKTFTASGGFASYTFKNSPITALGYSGTFTAVGSRMMPLTDSSSTHAEPLPGELPQP